jgi:hypothetical protein
LLAAHPSQPVPLMSKIVGFIIGAALIAAGAITGNPYLIIQGGVMIAAQAAVDLTMPKTPAREASEMSIALGEQPRVLSCSAKPERRAAWSTASTMAASTAPTGKSWSSASPTTSARG